MEKPKQWQNHLRFYIKVSDSYDSTWSLGVVIMCRFIRGNFPAIDLMQTMNTMAFFVILCDNGILCC